MVFTQRLQIIPLSYGQLVKYLQANDLLEKDLGFTKTSRQVAKDVKQMVEKFTMPKIKKAAASHFVFYTFWIIVEKSTGIIVAELGFKGPPDKCGMVEIGYGTMPGYEGMGFMTEAAAGMYGWAKARGDISTILASVNKNNLASLRIVQKNNFELYLQEGDMLWWKKKIYTS